MPILPLIIAHLVSTLDYIYFHENNALLLRNCSFSLKSVPVLGKSAVGIERVTFCSKSEHFC